LDAIPEKNPFYRLAKRLFFNDFGAYAGHEIEKNVKKHIVYRVTVKMNDGSFRTVSQAAAPGFAVGDKVRLVQGALRAEKS